MRRFVPPILVAVLVGGLAAPGAAQSPAADGASVSGPSPRVAEAEFGVRLTGVSGDEARYQRLRDLRDGPTLDRLRYERNTSDWLGRLTVDHAGYRDQHFGASLVRYGSIKASVDWNQVPLFYSGSTQTPFLEATPGVFRLSDATRAAVQGGTATTAAFGADLRRFDLRSRRDTLATKFAYAASRTVDLTVGFTSTARTGAQPYGGGFGFSSAVELPVPIDHRTNDMSAAIEWSTPKAMARVGYDGSWFANGVETLVFDNPVRLTDQISGGGDGPSQGRMALWPDSTSHTVSATGSLALPARTRAFAYLSIGSWLQDQQLLPFTINSAIAPVPLPRASAEAEARIVSMNYRLTSRPVRNLWLNGQVKRYDYDNRTPVFPVTQYVRLDGALAPSATGGSEPFGYKRQFVDLDASYTPLRFVAFRAGYGREDDDRTFRFLDRTTENVARASVDSTGLAWGSVRVQYEHGVRTGKGFDEQAFSDIGEQVSLRQFDISDRTRDRVTAIVQVVPVDFLGLNVSLGSGQEHRPGASFGLQDNDVLTLSVGTDVTFRGEAVLGVTYGVDRYTTLQRSRQANPGAQFNDPTRDWSTDLHERVHSVTASLDLPRVTTRTGARVAYDLVRSRAKYLYLLPVDSTLVAPEALPAVRNDMQQATVEVRHALTARVALGVGYAYDHYDVADFALSPGTLDSPLLPSFVNLTNVWRPYTAQTGSVRLFYVW